MLFLFATSVIVAMATRALPHGFPKCSALAQCRVFDVIKIVLQVHAALSMRDRMREKDGDNERKRNEIISRGSTAICLVVCA